MLVRRFLDTWDAKSTSNLHRHVKACWGKDTVSATDDTSDLKTAREALSKWKDLNGTITAAFERAGKGRVTYNHRQHTKAESRYVLTFPAINKMTKILIYSAEFVQWVAESKCPFQIVNDRSFRSLMKTGWPECYIPSAETVSRDVKKVFVRVRDRIATMLQVSLRYSMMGHFKLGLPTIRNTKGSLASPRMLGCLRIIKHSLQLPFILNTKGSRCCCCLTWWKFPCPIRARTRAEHECTRG